MKICSRKNVLLFILILLILPISFFAYKSFASFNKSASGDAPVSAAKFQIKVNDSTEITQTIDLSDTITTNDYSDDLVVPGTEGLIELVLDFTDTETSVDYTISLDTTNLPINLKFYSDSSHLNEITSISDSFIYGSTTTVNKNIYWLWEYKTDTASNTNDNLYMDSDIELPISIVLSQKIGGGN